MSKVSMALVSVVFLVLSACGDDVGVEVVQQPGREGDLDALADPLHRGALDVLVELLRLPVHLVADDGAGGATHHRADDGALGGRAGHLPDHPSHYRAAAGADHRAGLGLGGAAEEAGACREQEGEGCESMILAHEMLLGWSDE